MMYDAFFTYIIKASALLFVFWALYKTVLTRETFFNHNRRFLILGALTALALPLWVIEKVEVVQVAITKVSTTQIPPPPPLEIPETGIKIESLLFYIYVFGVIVFTLKFFIQLASLFRLIRKAQYRKRHKGLHLVFSAEVKAPFSFFNYIVLPLAFKEEEDASVILAHEGVHVKQHHSLDIVFMHLITIFIWINPIAWLYRKDVAQNLEYLADREVSNTTIPTKKYQYVLLKQHLSPQQLSIINPFINSLIKKRIVMLHQQPSNPTKLWKFGIAVPALIAFVLLFNVKTVAQYQITETAKGPNPPEEQTATLPQEKIEFTINKNTSDSMLETIKTAIADHGGEFKWKKLKRNKKGEITRIAVDFKHDSGKASATYESTSGIDPIFFGVSEDGGVYISSGKKEQSLKEVTWVEKDGDTKKVTDKEVIVVTSSKGEKDGNHFVIKGGKGNATWTTTSEGGKDAKFIVLEEKVKGEMDADGELHEKITVTLQELKEQDSTNGKSIIVTRLPAVEEVEKIHVMRLDESKGITNPLYIVDGKETKGNVMKTTDPANIESIEVLKGEMALEKYGEKGKDGVVIITTKSTQEKPMSPPMPPAINEIDFSTTAVWIDGKKATEKELKALSPEDIDFMEVIKGEKAQDQYGKPAAILIKTKQ